MANNPDDGPILGVLPDATGAASSRIGQACLACRRKKVKCDGQAPCHNCSSRDFTCEYPRSNDNASASRHYAKAFEDRFQQLDQFCQRLETLSSELSESIAAINQIRDTSRPLDGNFGTDDELQRAAQLLQSMPVHHGDLPMGNDAVATNTGERLGSRHGNSIDYLEGGSTAANNEEDGVDGIADGSDGDSDDNTGPDDDDFEFSDQHHDLNESSSRFGSLVADSYGRLRYLGGATNSVLIEAVKGLSPGGQSSMIESSPGSANAGTAAANIYANTTANLQIPLFVHGQRWPEMPYLPQPDEITRPPQYVADLLVNLYFDQLHYTFPVLYKPHFMSCYKQMSSSRSNTTDRKFLSVFFAVCACASSLLPSASDGKSTTFPGLEHYQKSLILHYASTGEASIERVQCLALLAMCSGGWNTLTQSWTFAGQAVRAAQDLGMHLSSLTAMSDQPSKVVKQQLCRRIWWTVYCLDRVTSICLGRPMAADDMDCHCEVPLGLPDEELEAYSQNNGSGSAPPNKGTSSPMTGFLAFTQLCRIGGRIQRLHSPSRIRELTDPRKAKRFFRSVASLQQSLDGWLASLPDEIRFSANVSERGPNLTMCVIMFIVHAGSLLNLYRSMSGSASQATLGSFGNEATSHCVSAARSCINAAELVRELVPPSHHLAFCVHYLTLSGLVLLRMPEHPREQALPDVDKCVRFLKGLEMTWSGASKGRAIIEHLLKAANQVGDGHVPEYLDDHSFTWTQLPGSELFGYEGFSSEFLNL